MDPVNPYNNLLDLKNSPNLDSFFPVLKAHAVPLLEMVENREKEICHEKSFKTVSATITHVESGRCAKCKGQENA